MKLYPRSKKKRIVRKWFKRTGMVRVVYIGKHKESGMYIHKPIVPIFLGSLMMGFRYSVDQISFL